MGNGILPTKCVRIPYFNSRRVLWLAYTMAWYWLYIKLSRLSRSANYNLIFTGLFVEIGKNMTAFIPAMHMSDVPLKNPEKKFKVGDKVKCRVLRVDPEKRKVHLTAKNILVNEDYPIVSNYDQQNVGKVTEGVVVSLSTEGILLQVLSLAQFILLFLGKRSIFYMY